MINEDGVCCHFRESQKLHTTETITQWITFTIHNLRSVRKTSVSQYKVFLTEKERPNLQPEYNCFPQKEGKHEQRINTLKNFS